MEVRAPSPEVNLWIEPGEGARPSMGKPGEGARRSMDKPGEGARPSRTDRNLTVPSKSLIHR